MQGDREPEHPDPIQDDGRLIESFRNWSKRLAVVAICFLLVVTMSKIVPMFLKAFQVYQGRVFVPVHSLSMGNNLDSPETVWDEPTVSPLRVNCKSEQSYVVVLEDDIPFDEVVGEL